MPKRVFERDPMEELLEHIYDYVQKHRLLRNKQGDVFEPELKDIDTFAYKYKCGMKELVYSCVLPENKRAYHLLIKQFEKVGVIVNILNSMPDRRFPILSRCRYLYSFLNGVFDAQSCVFYKLDGRPIPELQKYNATSVFFGLDFEKTDIPPANASISELVSLLFKHRFFASFFRQQEYSEMDVFLFMSSIGRCLCTDVAQDSVPYIVSPPNTGVSTLLKLMMRFVPTDDMEDDLSSHWDIHKSQGLIFAVQEATGEKQVEASFLKETRPVICKSHCYPKFNDVESEKKFEIWEFKNILDEIHTPDWFDLPKILGVIARMFEFCYDQSLSDSDRMKQTRQIYQESLLELLDFSRKWLQR